MAQTSRWAASKPIGQGLRVQVKRLAAESEMLPLLPGICTWVALCFVCFSWVRCPHLAFGDVSASYFNKGRVRASRGATAAALRASLLQDTQ